MPRTKNKYPVPAPALEPVVLPEPQHVSFVAAGLPYSFDLKGASAYVDFSVTDLRAAITSGALAVVSNKPCRMRRVDLEKWVDARKHFIRKP